MSDLRGVPLVRIPSGPRRVHEIDDGAQFARAMDRAAETPVVELWVQVRDDGAAEEWKDEQLVESGRWSGDMPIPSMSDVVAILRRSGARYARLVVRAQI